MAFGIIDHDDPAPDDGMSEVEYCLIEMEIARLEVAHVLIANELQRLRMRLGEMEARLLGELKMPARG